METLNSPETKSINKFLLIIATVSFYLASTLIKTKERQKIACFFGNIFFACTAYVPAMTMITTFFDLRSQPLQQNITIENLF